MVLFGRNIDVINALCISKVGSGGDMDWNGDQPRFNSSGCDNVVIIVCYVHWVGLDDVLQDRCQTYVWTKLVIIHYKYVIVENLDDVFIKLLLR